MAIDSLLGKHNFADFRRLFRRILKLKNFFRTQVVCHINFWWAGVFGFWLLVKSRCRVGFLSQNMAKILFVLYLKSLIIVMVWLGKVLPRCFWYVFMWPRFYMFIQSSSKCFKPKNVFSPSYFSKTYKKSQNQILSKRPGLELGNSASSNWQLTHYSTETMWRSK